MKPTVLRFFKQCSILALVALVVSTCEREHEVEKLPQNKNYFEIRKIDYDEILHVDNLKEPLEKIRGTLVTGKDIFNRPYYYSQENNSDKIQIAINKAIVVKRDGYESYSFKILNPNLEKSSFENLIIERNNESDYKYFIYTYEKKYNVENAGETIEVKRKEVTANQINLSNFSNLFSYKMAGESCVVDVYIDFDCGCIYIKVISCNNGGGGGTDENDDNDNDGSDNDNGNNNNTGDSGNNTTSGNGGGSGGSGEGGGKNHPTIGIFDDIDPCHEGYIKNKDGNCVEQPCPGDPVPNPEIAPQLGPSGMSGGLHNTCTRTGSGCAGNTSRQAHNGVDIKNPYGAPVYAMYDGVATKATQYKNGKIVGSGHQVSITSTVNGESLRLVYFHLQENNRASGTVSAGDIIGYQGISGNLAVAIKKGYTTSHVHIKAELNGQKTDPLNYFATTIDPQTGQVSDPCN